MDAEQDATQAGDTMLKMPKMIYGTAWKKERTAELVYQAIKTGFRGIDTAAMRRHYDEKLTGDGIRRAIHDGLVRREDLYIQTKFSPGDDAFADASRYPTIAAQVHASVAASLTHLSTPDTPTPYLDCVVLHSPYDSHADTLAAWTALAALVPTRVRTLGISNVTLPELEALCSVAYPPVSVVQNRFRLAERAWDVEVRAFCAARGIVYQGFWTLTGTPDEWRGARYVGRVAEGAGVDRVTAWYALLQALGLVVLNGTTSEVHMREGLDGLEKVDAWRGTPEGGRMFEACLDVLRERVG